MLELASLGAQVLHNRSVEMAKKYNVPLEVLTSLEEKPGTVYIVKLPRPKAGGKSKKINHSISQWQRGYIRKRLTQKCREQSVEIVEVLGKDISNECSCCGAFGKKEENRFRCPVCGYEDGEKTNTARNVKKRGQGDGALR